MWEHIFAQLPCMGLVASASRLQHVNQQALATFGLDAASLLSLPGLPSLFVPEHATDVAHALDEALQLGASAPRELLLRRGSGETLEVELRLSRAPGHEGAVIAVLTDVSHRVSDTQTLKQLAYHDSLTGLPNRARFTDALTLAIRSARRQADALAVAALDLDGFKAVNDEAGHEAGDRVLREVAERLSGTLRGTDLVARVGGDEFALLLPGITTAAEARTTFEKVHRAFARPFFAGRFHLGASVGVALSVELGADPQVLLRAADEAMYAAKRGGKGRTVIAQRGALGSDEPAVAPFAWSDALRLGVPETDADHRELLDGALALLEALARGDDAEGVRTLFERLQRHTHEHFAHEEALMVATDYPHRERHAQEHARLARELERLGQGLDGRGLAELTCFARDWLLGHMRHADRLFVEAVTPASPNGWSAAAT